jgi:Family of unknown function (DUF6314)
MIAPEDAAAAAVSPGSAPWGPADEIPERLAGSWSLDRAVSEGCSITGTARFEPDGGFLRHGEHVRWRLADGRELEGERAYLFAADEGGFCVLFAENPPRLFHRIALGRIGVDLVGYGTHVCAEDRYDSRYEFCADGLIAVRHDVRGPRKRYAIATRYFRVSSPAGGDATSIAR